MEDFAPLLWIVAIAVIFWLLIIRPSQRRQKDIARVQAALAPGETVVLTSGIYGTVSQIEDAALVVEVAPGVNIKVARGAIASVVRRDEPADEATDSTESTDSTDSTDIDGEER